MTKKCKVCGETQTVKEAKFCTICGSSIDDSGASGDDGSNSITVYVPKVKSLNVPYTIDAKAILKELNDLRANPGAFGQKLLDEIVPCFNGMTYTSKEGGERLTSEGAAAVREAGEWLISHNEPAQALKSSFGLLKIAKELCSEQNACDSIGGFSCNGNGLNKRVEKYGSWSGKISECLFYHAVSPYDVIVQLVVDDGLKSRPNRARLLDPDFCIAGIWGSSHKIYGNVISIILAQKYERDGNNDAIRPLKIVRNAQQRTLSATLEDTNLLTDENLVITKKGSYISVENPRLLTFLKWKIPANFPEISEVGARKGEDGNVVIDFFIDEKVAPNLAEGQKFTLKESGSSDAGDAPKVGSVEFVDKKKKDSIKVCVAPIKKPLEINVSASFNSEKLGFSIDFEFGFECVTTEDSKKSVVAMKTKQSVHVTRSIADISCTVDDKNGLVAIVKFAENTARNDETEKVIPLK